MSSRFAKQATKNPLVIEKKSMGDTVNFLGTQYFPVMTADDETLIFTGLTENRDARISISPTVSKATARRTVGDLPERNLQSH